MPHAGTRFERNLATLCAAAALWCNAASAQTTPPAVSVEWDAPPECPNAAAVEREIMQILSASTAPTVGLRARGVVSRLSLDRWRAELVLRGMDWEARRTLEGATCSAVADAAALVIALAINPQVEPPAPKPAPPKPAVQPEPAPAPEPIDQPTKRPVGPARRFSTGQPFVGVGIASDVGALPGPALGAEGLLGWQIGGARLDVGGTYFLPRRGTLPARSDIGATFHLGAINLRGCYQWAYESLALGPCADAGLTWTRAQGFGPIIPYEVSTVGLTVGADVAVHWQLSRVFRPYFRAGSVLPLARPAFAVQGLETFHRAGIASIRGAIGLEIHVE